MTKNKIIFLIVIFLLIPFSEFISGCTKIQKGYLSPLIKYSSLEFSFIRGRVSTSAVLLPDGSSNPLNVKLLHVYDSTGKNVDAIFLKTYPTSVWIEKHDPKVDITVDQILKKRSFKDLTPISVNEKNGAVTSNPSSIHLPTGSFTIDLQVSNIEGTEVLKKILKLNIADGSRVETWQYDIIANGIALANQTPVAYTFRGSNNPFVITDIKVIADTPNLVIFKFVGKDGIPFNPKTGEVKKRPNGGLNPIPPFLQNLQDYQPDTYVTTDSNMSVKYPIAPFPIVSMGNGFMFYYNIKASAVKIDSTSSWGASQPGVYYQGSSDPHYLGQYTPEKYDYSLRIPFRIFVPGAYEVTIRMLNMNHK